MKTSKGITFFIFVLFASIACKKEETVSNDPNIEDLILNYSAENTNVEEQISSVLYITGGGRPDFRFKISHPSEDVNQHSILLEVLNEEFQFLAYFPSDATAIQRITKNTEINSSNTTWTGNNILMYHYIISGANISDYGFSDIGDQYIAFRQKNSEGAYFYGWMLVNIERGEKITIKEYALHKIANTPILAGEK